MIKCLKSSKNMKVNRSAIEDGEVGGTSIDVTANMICVVELLVPMMFRQKAPKSAFLSFNFFLGFQKM